MNNKVLEKLAQGLPVLGTITHMKSPAAVEALGAAGLDYVMLDMEHCPMDWDDVQNAITASDAAGIEPFVRIPEGSRSAVLHALDVGAKGVVVPCIEHVEQVKALVSCAKFQPTGARGYCMTRDGKWGYDAAYAKGLTGYMRESNAKTMLIPQCETLGCLKQIEDIAALPGVDGILIGPYDLSIAMGLDGQFAHPDFRAAVARILSACKANGKMSMIFVGSTEDMRQRLDEGFDNILFGLDILSLIGHYTSIAESFRDCITKKEG
jgi:2-keto-3-deoxy-L-rhamnonate aldolase RhmA